MWDGVAEGDADGVDGVGGDAVSEGHGRRGEAVVDEGVLLVDEGRGVVGEVGEECDGLGGWEEGEELAAGDL